MTIESIADGTWASGPWPEEIVIVDVLLETRWSWTDWCTTPAYIQQVVIDVIQARRAQEQAEGERRQAQMEAAKRHGQ